MIVFYIDYYILCDSFCCFLLYQLLRELKNYLCLISIQMFLMGRGC